MTELKLAKIMFGDRVKRQKNLDGVTLKGVALKLKNFSWLITFTVPPIFFRRKN